MKSAAALTAVLISVALGAALAGKSINDITASPDLLDLASVDTTGDASFSEPNISKDDKVDLAPLSDLKESLKEKTPPPPKDSLKEILAPPVNAILSALSVPPVDDILSSISTPPPSGTLTAVSGTPVLIPPVLTPEPAKDLKDIADKIIVFSPPPPEDLVLDKEDKDDKLKKPDLLKDDKDDKDLEVPVYAFSFASPPKKDLDKDPKDKKDKKDALKSLLGRRLL